MLKFVNMIIFCSVEYCATFVTHLICTSLSFMCINVVVNICASAIEKRRDKLTIVIFYVVIWNGHYALCPVKADARIM